MPTELYSVRRKMAKRSKRKIRHLPVELRPHVGQQAEAGYFSQGRALELKGKSAEQIVHQLAEGTFFKDWCFPNAMLTKGKELCDLLVVFGHISIIWQVKDLKLRDNGRFDPAEVEKNLRQLNGARRQLFDLKAKVTLQDARGQEEDFDSTPISEIYLISVLTGPEQDFYSPVEQIKNFTAHVFSGRTLEILLRELDTVADFVDYLREEERLFATENHIMINGGEEELLGYYLTNERSFRDLQESDIILLTDGHWESYLKRDQVRAKRSHDEISYLWDKIIDFAHTSGGQYKLIIRQMAKLSRFKRRIAAKTFWDLLETASRNRHPDLVFRRLFEMEGTTYTFLFTPKQKPREMRKRLLEAQCLVARDRNRDTPVVVGIATDSSMRGTGSFDFCLLNFPEWNPEDESLAESLRQELGIWENAVFQHQHEDEYPQ